ncbi:MAG: DUF1559 domain-containing protein [Planctomycetaceae bacterium]|nr:DUF1559 domain-containing protein [Planctomycetaceae bacterium]
MTTCLRHRRGFTIVELLVVVAVVAIVVALSLPAVQQARDQARDNACKSNLQQIGLALHNYHDVFGTFPPGWVAKDVKAETGPCYGWGVMLSPFLDQAPLYNKLNFNKHPGIADELLQTRIPQFRCPADTSEDANPVREEYGTSNYSGNYGNLLLPGSVDAPTKANGIFYWNSRVGMRDIVDGTSNTFLVGERSISSAAAIWMGVRSNQNAGDSVTSCNHSVRLNTVLDAFSSRHEGGAHFLMCDGAVKFISDNIDSQAGDDPPKGTYQKLAHKSDGMPVGDFGGK